MTTLQERTEQAADDELVLSRHIDAARHLVFQAFTDPKHLANWWGPRGFSTTTHEHDFRPGGVWRFTMHGPDGTDYHDRVVFEEIRADERLSYHINGEGEHAGFAFHTTFSFEDEADGTRLTLRMRFGSPAMLQQMIEKFGALEGGRQTLERLAEQLALTNEDAVEIHRDFDAPRDLVWAAWTQAEHLGQWFGCKGSTISNVSLALQPGGDFRYLMTVCEQGIWGRWTFLEIDAPRRFVYTAAVTDEAGQVIAPPFAPEWPRETLSETVFEEIAPGRTRVTLRWSAWEATEAQRAAFAASRDSMDAGWAGTFEMLDAYLARMPREQAPATTGTTLTPHLICTDANAALAFYERVLGGKPGMVLRRPDGMLMHAQISFGTSNLYLAEACPEWGAHDPKHLGGSPVTLHLQVPDCDAVFARALAAGCTVRMPLEDQFWGDRYGTFVDPWGHIWAVATTKFTPTPEEIERAFAEMSAGMK